jgi:hypothetical protein
MKQLPILIFTISTFFLVGLTTVDAQTQTDTIKFKEKYGLRVGADISKLITAALNLWETIEFIKIIMLLPK